MFLRNLAHLLENKMKNKKCNEFTARDYLTASLICIIFYSFLLGSLLSNLSFKPMANPSVVPSDSAIFKVLRFGGLFAWLVVSSIFAYGSVNALQRIGFGTIVVSTAVFIAQNVFSLNVILASLIQGILSIVIIISLAVSLHRQIIE